MRKYACVISCFVGCACIFGIVFALYRIPLKAVLYPTLLCVVLLFLVLIPSAAAMKKRKNYMNWLVRLAPDQILDEMSDKTRMDEEDVRADAIISVCRQYMRLRESMTKRYEGMNDYYTLWMHQIKTPLAAMRLILQRDECERSDPHTVKELRDELFRVEQYVEMALIYLRLESESGDYVFGRYALDPIIRESIKKFSGQFIRRRIQLLYTPSEECVVTDEKWLSFVVEQILSNALKYTNKGHVSITFEKPCTLCISDTGIGIAGEDLPRIFEKSYTGHNGRKDRKSSGIGLYLCRKICEKLGHSLRISSVVGEGTTVRICMEQKDVQVE